MSLECKRCKVAADQTTADALLMSKSLVLTLANYLNPKAFINEGKGRNGWLKNKNTLVKLLFDTMCCFTGTCEFSLVQNGLEILSASCMA